MKKALATLAVVALLLVVAGCPGAQKVKDLEAQVAAQQQKITELEGQVATLTATNDSLTKVIADMVAQQQKAGAKQTTKSGGTQPGTLKPPTQK